MSKTVEGIRHALDHKIDFLEMAAFNDGFEAATNALDEMSDNLHNEHNHEAAEILRWAAKELRGENV